MTETALGIAATGMSAQQLRLEVEAHNISNMNTAAYQRRTALFTTMMYQDMKRVGTISSSTGTVIPAGIQVGMGVKPAGVVRSLEMGNNIQSNDAYHMAIQGNGYFQVELPSGSTAYTRAGLFTTNAEGALVTQEGYTVLPNITVPQGTVDVTINTNGEVFAKIDGQEEPQNLGTIELANFMNPQGLEAISDNLFLETPASGNAITGTPGGEGFGKILQRWYEGSNANAVTAVTDLITTQRAFEMNTKSMKTAEEMMKELKSVGAA